MLYIPPNFDDTGKPLVFLAGPIHGAPRWQNLAVEYLASNGNRFNIASPRYIGKKEEIIGDWAPGAHDIQIDWETHHLRKAGKEGVILFWLAKEQTHSCERAYAQTTRIELGEWKVRHEKENARVVVGIEEGFPGSGYIKYRLLKSYPKVPLESTLEETCERAIELLK